MPEEKKEEAQEKTAKEPQESRQKTAKEPQESRQKTAKEKRSQDAQSFDKESWNPKTEIGKLVKKGDITDISQILDKGQKIMEQEIADLLLPNLSSELLLIGQSKGKFGGGQRRVFKQTQKKTQEGNKPKFATFAIVGNENGYVGVGYGKSKETVPAREKAIRNAKINMIKIRRGCGSWQCGCGNPHTIPFSVAGKCGSVRVKLIPAPRGTGLRIEKECQKILKAAGIKDIWSETRGQTKSKINLIHACFDSLKNLIMMKTTPRSTEKLGMLEGDIKQEND